MNKLANVKVPISDTGGFVSSLSGCPYHFVSNVSWSNAVSNQCLQNLFQQESLSLLNFLNIHFVVRIKYFLKY